MSLNFREIDLVLKELDLAGSRIDKINQPDRFSLFLGTYSHRGKQNILINLTQGSVCINRISKKPLYPPFPPRFAQLLRARIKGGTILSVSQPEMERILHFTISCRTEKLNLWVRLWGGNTNMILTDDSNKIIDVFFRKPKQKEIQGEVFIPDFSHVREKSDEERPVRDYKNASDFNSFLESENGESRQIHDYTNEKEKILNQLEQKKNRALSHMIRLEERQTRFSQWENLKRTGDLIRANIFKIKKGDNSVEVEDYSKKNQLITIELKSKLTPQQNCDYYFNQYKKYKNGFSITTDDIEIQKKLITQLNEQYQAVSNCHNLEELSVFSKVEKKIGLKKSQPQTGLQFLSAGFVIHVGRNSKENDQLLRKYARGNDIWLHVRDFPGGYVFIKTLKGKSIPLDTLLDGANLALLYSSKKYKDKADIHYTEVKNLRRVKGGKEGLVLAQNEKNLFIKYDLKRISRLQNKSELETIHRNTDN